MLRPSVDSRDPATERDVRRLHERLSWDTVLRAAGLLVLAILMIWLAFNIELPDRESVRSSIEDFGWWSWLVFLLAYAVVALTPIPVTLMALTGGALFGVIIGTLLSLIGAMVGSIVAYWIARFLGKDLVLGLLRSHRGTVESYLEDAGFQSVFTLRLLPGMPYWPINYGSGALSVPFREFALASATASLPGQISLVAVGAFAARPSITGGIIVVTSWVTIIVMTLVALRSWKRAIRGTPNAQVPDEATRRAQR